MKANNSGINLTEINDVLQDEENTIEYDGKTYYLRYLNDKKGSKGGNSSVFVLHDSTGIEPQRAIKISNVPKQPRKSTPSKLRRYARFMNEIAALTQLKGKSENIIQIDFDGVVTIGGNEYPYYVMEKADTDLKEYFFSENDIDEQTKVEYCIHIFNALNDLHNQNIYHRDIKPDNILLFFEDENQEKVIWKIGDLGLIASREIDYDDIRERVGPFGWHSPEAMNKYLTEGKNLNFDCKIDDKSDVFQLGKLFWFIFQLNVPIGQICYQDFICNLRYKQDAFDIIFCMLNHSKTRRAEMDLVKLYLDDLAKKYAVA